MGLKVAMVTPWGKNVRCGIRTYSESLVEALAQLGVEVYIIRLPRFGRKTPEILQMIAESIPIDKVDLVHVSHEYGLYQDLEGGFYDALKRTGKPILTTCHAVGNFSIDSIIAEASDRLIVHNEFCRSRLSYPEKTVIIPHGCTPQKCLPMEEAKRSYGLKPEWPIVGYLGFISNYKGLETIIDAMEGLPDAGLLIGGGWHIESETIYIAQIKTKSFNVLPGRVQWLGYVPDEELPKAYGAMDIVVYPSRFSTESGALLMALSHGKAVIASDLPPFREKGEAVTTFEDGEDLRMKIAMILGNEELRISLEEKARKYAEDNSWDRIAEKHLELYEDIITI